MDKNAGSKRMDRRHATEGKKAVPELVKFGLIAAAIIAAIVIGIIIYINLVGSYVATVDGQKIKTNEFMYYLQNQEQAMYQKALAIDSSVSWETFWATPIDGEDAVEYAKRIALEYLKSLKIQYAKAKEAKISPTKEEIKKLDESIQNYIIETTGESNKIKANSAFKKQSGFSVGELREMQIQMYTVQLYQNAEMEKTADTEANIETYYEKYPEWYKENISARSDAEEAVWARHILIKVDKEAAQEEKDTAKKKAEDLISQLKGGADFAALAAENSEDEGSKDAGGAYIFGKGDMVAPFEEAAFALNPGQITEVPVLTEHGYHILKLEEKCAEGQPVSLRCAKEFSGYGINFIRSKLYMEKLEGWIKDARYELNSKAYNSIKLNDAI